MQKIIAIKIKSFVTLVAEEAKRKNNENIKVQKTIVCTHATLCPPHNLCKASK